MNYGVESVFTVSVDAAPAGSDLAVMLIDLSAGNPLGTTWKHKETGVVVLQRLLLQAATDTDLVGDVTLGFLSAVDGDNGDVNVIHRIQLSEAIEAQVVVDIDFNQFGGFRCSTAKHFGPTLSNDALFQNDVNLLSPSGAADTPSGDGDLVLRIEGSAGNGAVTALVWYTTEV